GDPGAHLLVVAGRGLAPGVEEHGVGPLRVGQQVAQESEHGESLPGARAWRDCIPGPANANPWPRSPAGATSCCIPRSAPSLEVVVLPGNCAVCRLPPGEPFPAWATGPFLSLTRTPDELSVVCREEAVPEGVRCEGGWKCLRVAGTLDFAQVGVLAA